MDENLSVFDFPKRVKTTSGCRCLLHQDVPLAYIGMSVRSTSGCRFKGLYNSSSTSSMGMAFSFPSRSNFKHRKASFSPSLTSSSLITGSSSSTAFARFFDLGRTMRRTLSSRFQSSVSKMARAPVPRGRPLIPSLS